MLCPNCESDKHIACCRRCGCTLSAKRAAVSDFCTMNCEAEQGQEDALSDLSERILQEHDS